MEREDGTEGKWKREAGEGRGRNVGVLTNKARKAGGAAVAVPRQRAAREQYVTRAVRG